MSTRGRKKRLGWFRVFIILFLLLFMTAIGTGAGFLVGTLKNLPEVVESPQPSQTSFIYDAHGNFLTKLPTHEDRVVVKLEDIPKHLQDAVVAIEDERFWNHWGPDFQGIMRALYVDITTGGYTQGASTITQQLVKNTFLRPEKTIKRKIQELFLAVQMERRFTKHEILEMYLNQIYFGQNAFGVQAAAQLYFGKDVSSLNLAESALLAGIINLPNEYSPFTNPDGARARQALVLNAMVKNGFISREDAEMARSTPLKFASKTKGEATRYPAPYFVDYVLSQLLQRYPKDVVYGGGLKIYTTIDMKIQKALDEAFQKYIDPRFPLGEGKEVPEAAAVFLEPHTGYIRAMRGGRVHDRLLALNRAVQSKRQPGSAFKPIAVYTPAIDKGYSPSTVVDDYPVTYRVGKETWTPINYNKKYLGLTTIRKALELSINVVAVKVLHHLGVETGIEYAQKMGITTLITDRSRPHNDYVLPIALGGLTEGVTPLEMARAYAVLASGGMRVKPIAILKVVDRNGNVLEENPPERTVVLNQETAYLVTDMLKGVIERGTGTTARIGRPAAGKTGTTSEDRDAWFVGYTPNLAGAVWMGYDKPQGMQKIWGSTIPAPIWKDVMLAAHEGLPAEDFPAPKNIVRVKVCNVSGELPGDYCPQESIVEELFVKGNEPAGECSVHLVLPVCTEADGQLAGPYCPAGTTQQKVFIKRPVPWEPFTDEDGKTYEPMDAPLEAPTQVCTMHGPGASAAPPAGNGIGLTITFKERSFEPNQLSVRAGSLVRLELVSEEGFHTFALPALGIYRVLAPGGKVAVEFRPNVQGVYKFFCAVHGEDSMSGQLTVTE